MLSDAHKPRVPQSLSDEIYSEDKMPISVSMIALGTRLVIMVADVPAATIEHGALGVAACEFSKRECRRDCPNLSIPRAGALRRDLPDHLRGNALDHASAHPD